MRKIIKNCRSALKKLRNDVTSGCASTPKTCVDKFCPKSGCNRVKSCVVYRIPRVEHFCPPPPTCVCPYLAVVNDSPLLQDFPAHSLMEIGLTYS